MTVTQVQGYFHTDSDMEDGFVELTVWDDGDKAVFTSPATFKALFYAGLQARAMDFVEARGPGMHRIPRSVVEPAAAEDLRHQISVADPAAMGDGCVHAHCQQDVVSREHGFPTCQLHTDLMVEWDDLVAS